MSEPRVTWLSRLGLALLVCGALPAASDAAHAQSTGGGRHASAPASKPRVDLTQPAESTDFTQAVTHDLNGVYDRYNAFKTTVQNDLDIQFSMPVSVFGQWGTPNSGPGVVQLVYSPTVTWTPFTNTAIGSGAFTFSFQGNQFWTHANTNSQQGSMGLLAAPNDWGSNGYQYAQLTYTHTLPGNWLAVSGARSSSETIPLRFGLKTGLDVVPIIVNGTPEVALRPKVAARAPGECKLARMSNFS